MDSRSGSAPQSAARWAACCLTFSIRRYVHIIADLALRFAGAFQAFHLREVPAEVAVLALAACDDLTTRNRLAWACSAALGRQVG